MLASEGSEQQTISVDDSGPQTEPFYCDRAGFAWSTLFEFSRDCVKAVGNITGGALLGLTWGTVGLVRGLIYDIPHAILTQTPDLFFRLIDTEVELWNSIKDADTADGRLARVAFFSGIGNVIQLAAKETPWLIKSSSALYNSVEQAVAKHFDDLALRWFRDDWQGALRDLTQETTEGVVNIAGPAAIGKLAVAIAPGMLARLPSIEEAYAASKAALYDSVRTALEAIDAQKLVTAEQALSALLDTVRAGYAFTIQEMAQLFGLSADQALWLENFSRDNKVLITFRSRAEESLRWLAKGGKLKPFWVKLKTVSLEDIKYLGYQASDLGRVIIKKPPSSQEFLSRISHLPHGSAEYQTALERFGLRNEEWFTKKPGYAQDMLRWGKEGEVTGKWPWSDNGVNPNVQADQSSRWRFRLQPAKDRFGKVIPGEYVPEIGTEFGQPAGEYGSITGDQDMLAMQNADGTPIGTEFGTGPEAEAKADQRYVELLKKIAAGPLGALHPESATWSLNGRFWFAAKEGYFTGACCDLQFGADGVGRAVSANLKRSTLDLTGVNRYNYRLVWNGAAVQ